MVKINLASLGHIKAQKTVVHLLGLAGHPFRLINAIAAALDQKAGFHGKPAA